jgi:hypothetical protein
MCVYVYVWFLYVCVNATALIGERPLLAISRVAYAI